jgi:multidrug resistance protein, MATE family
MWVQTKTWFSERARARGNVGEVALLAYPVVLQTVAETTMSVIDSAMIGRLGVTQLGGVGLASIWIWTLFSPLSGTASGVQVFVSRHDGAGEHERCGPWLWQALGVLVPATLLWMVALALLLPWLYHWVGAEPALQTAALEYSWARLPGGPAIVANFALNAFFRGLGNTRVSLRAALIGIAVNVVLAWTLIFGHFGAPRLGVAGAGLAMSAGSWTACAVLLLALLQKPMRRRYRTSPSAGRREALLRYLRTSAPIGGQWLLDMTTFAIFTSIVARMGEASMAASQAMLQLLSISFMQAVAIAIAAGALIGRYIGAGDLDAAQRSYRSAQLLGFGLSALVGTLFLTAPRLLLAIFSDDPAVLSLAAPLLALGAAFQFVDAVGIIAGGALRGAGDTRWPFAVQASMAWIVRLPVVYVAAVVLSGGVFGAWAGELVYVAALGLALTGRVRAGHWRHMRI